MNKYITKRNLIIAGIIILLSFLFIRPVVGKIYCQNKVDALEARDSKMIEDAYIEKQKNNDNTNLTKLFNFAKEIRDTEYKNCLHRWGE